MPRTYDIGRASCHVQNESDQRADLVELDRRISEEYASKASGGALGTPWLQLHTWERWLWGTNPHEEFHPDVMMNENHLLGLFLARYMATYYEQAAQANLSALLPRPLHLFPCKAADLTLRQLRDTVQNLQCYWMRERAYEMPNSMAFLDACMCRFGQLAIEGGDAEVMNDQGAVEDDVCGKLRLTGTSIRRFVSVLLIFYRHLYIETNRVDIDAPGDQGFDCNILLHHMRSACDEYYDLSLHWALMPGYKLLYVHDFPSMFHSISQVVYFHNADHALVPHDLRPELATVGQMEAVHVVPVLQHLYPDIDVLFECADLVEHSTKNRYAFFVIARRVYLLTPEIKFYFHPNVTMLLKKYLDDVKKV